MANFTLPAFQSGDRRQPPVGKYRVELVAIEPAQSSSMFGNAPRAKWTMKIVSVVASNDSAAHTVVGQTYSEYTSVTMAPLSKMYAFTTALLGRPVTAQDGELTPDQLIGRRMIITLVLYTKQDGSTGVKIDAVEPEPDF